MIAWVARNAGIASDVMSAKVARVVLIVRGVNIVQVALIQTVAGLVIACLIAATRHRSETFKDYHV